MKMNDIEYVYSKERHQFGLPIRLCDNKPELRIDITPYSHVDPTIVISDSKEMGCQVSTDLSEHEVSLLNQRAVRKFGGN